MVLGLSMVTVVFLVSQVRLDFTGRVLSVGKKIYVRNVATSSAVFETTERTRRIELGGWLASYVLRTSAWEVRGWQN